MEFVESEKDKRERISNFYLLIIFNTCRRIQILVREVISL